MDLAWETSIDSTFNPLVSPSQSAIIYVIAEPAYDASDCATF